ncbi:MAG: 3-hydroxybutyryl-CoA dehydrogenase [Dehalococcoidia bacterium]|nr:3-hydroxybutyryl-CoA dehydrogenase [Dehalococcoidia bacterium]
MKIQKVGVVGCGLMGAGIAQVSAQSGFQTVVSEINDDLLNKGMSSIQRLLAKAVEKGKMTKEDQDAVLARLRGTTKVEDFAGCDIVVEAAVENLDIKKRIFADLDRICPPHAVLASNTSCLPVTEIAMATKRPHQVIGTHFFNPVPLMKLLEVVTTVISSQETLDTVKALGQSMGKTVIVAKDTPAFIVNRLLAPLMMESIRMLECGLATKEDIDNGAVLGLNHPMGPLTLADFVGLDTLFFISEAMYDETKDPKFAAPLLLKRMVTAGQLGRKTGKGFYDYK